MVTMTYQSAELQTPSARHTNEIAQTPQRENETDILWHFRVKENSLL